MSLRMQLAPLPVISQSMSWLMRSCGISVMLDLQPQGFRLPHDNERVHLMACSADNSHTLIVGSKFKDFLKRHLNFAHVRPMSHIRNACSSLETLDADDKFFCDTCQSYQEAQRRMKIKKLPPVLCLHLKRFKYIEQYER